MVSGEREQKRIDQDNMLEVIDHTFAVQEIHGGSKKIPIQTLCELQLLLARRHICDSDDLFEGYDLHGANQRHDVDMAGRHSPEEGSYHHQCPYCPSYECLFLLFVL